MAHNRRVPDHDETADATDRDATDADADATGRDATDADATATGRDATDRDATDRDVSGDAPAALPDEPPRRAKGLGVGYRADEVDAFLAELWQAMERPKPTMAPYEVADARFKVTRVRRRYQMRSVDDYLERIQAVLRERHGADAVADVEGHLSAPRHVRTGWIYAIALVLVVVMLAFAFTQL